MKKKQVLAVSSALMIGTTTALTGLPTPVMAQENTEVVQEAIVEENKTEQVPVEQETEKAEVQENVTDKEQEKTAESTEISKEDLTEETTKQETPATPEKEVVTEDKTVEESKNTEVKAGSIAIDEAHFPNRAFRLYVQTNFDKNNDNSLSPDEINNVTSMTIQEGSNKEFTSIQGIELFTNLENLSLDAPLKELDLSKNTNLKNLEIRSLNMWGFDVSKNTNLKSLTANSNYTWYNIGNNPNLETVNVGNTHLWITTEKNHFYFKDICKGIDISKVTILQNGKLDKDTGIGYIDDVNKDFIYQYDCGTYKGGKKTLEITVHILGTSSLPDIFAEDVTLKVGDTFDPLKNVTASDFEDGPITLTQENIIQNDVDTSKAGIYHVTYKVTDSEGKSSRKVITVTVEGSTDIPNTPPTISAKDVTLNVGDTFNPLKDVTATDKEDGTITLTKDNIISNDVDTSKAGTYHVTYKVTDKNGASIEKTITVIVKQNTGNLNSAPIISANDVTLNIGDTFNPLTNVTATDKEDGTITLTKDNIVANDVDTSKAGTYHVTFRVVDKNGAITEKTITVTVKEKATNKPVSPQQPQKPTTPTKPSGQKNPVKTGDMTNVGLFASMFAGSTGALAVLFGKKRKRNKND
ncbi:MAG: immunoglobulin-like domain-containing protein [Anaerobutyricum hallii]|uniref:immunoglobulin-like domain-containing protein n=1 Tax=Anaerobutyricum hallii TaxID=39488 RepID=UPI0039906E68